MDKFLKKKPVEDQVASGSRNILKKSRAPVIFWLIFLRSRVYVLRFLNMTQLIKIKEFVYPLIYLLIKLALTLPVATATVVTTFSVMKIVKNLLRNRMGDQWMNDCLITFIEKDVLNKIDNELILQYFQKMSTRRGQL